MMINYEKLAKNHVLEKNELGVYLPYSYLDFCNGNEAIVLGEIVFWHGVSKETGKPRMTHVRDGERWLVMTYSKFS